MNAEELEQTTVAELEETFGLEANEGESRQVYAKRMAMKAYKAEEDDWKALREETQGWVNAVLEAVDEGHNIPLPDGIEDAIPVDEEGEAAGSTADNVEADIEDASGDEAADDSQEDADMSTAEATTKTKSPSKKPAKAPKATKGKARPGRAAAANTARQPARRKKRSGDEHGSKTKLVGELLTRKEGCLRSDILEATGWPSISVQAMAKSLGLKLSTKKEERHLRYFGK